MSEIKELWDLYDENRRPLGRTHTRGRDLPAGTFHIVVEIWTINSNGEILLTLRDKNKETYPDKWECTGGSILAGETSREGAARELMEETGIRCRPEEIIFIAEQKPKAEAFHDTFLLKRDIEISALTMQEGETSAAKWVTVEEIHEMIKSGELAKPICEKFLAQEEKIKFYLK